MNHRPNVIMLFRLVHVLYLDGTILDFRVSLAVAPVPSMLYKIPAENNKKNWQ